MGVSHFLCVVLHREAGAFVLEIGPCAKGNAMGSGIEAVFRGRVQHLRVVFPGVGQAASVASGFWVERN